MIADPELLMWHRLALHIGGATVRELQGRMGMDEFINWHAYAALEPFGGDTDFLRSGIIAAAIANSNRGKGTKPYSASDFMPDFKKRFQPVVKQTTQTIKKFMLGLVNATTNKGKKGRK